MPDNYMVSFYFHTIKDKVNRRYKNSILIFTLKRLIRQGGKNKW